MQEAAIGLGVLMAIIVAFNTRDPVRAVIACVVVVAVLGALIIAVERRRNRRLTRSGMAEIDSMTGEQFEDYLRALFVARGYEATLTRNGTDHGGDVILQKRGRRTVVQAKRRRRTVGIAAVQEALRAKKHYRTHRAMVVCIGGYTREAISEAEAKEVELWDRDRLAREVALVTGARVDAAVAATPVCPRCGQTMIMRTNRHDGSSFWGCRSFPSCRGTRRA